MSPAPGTDLLADAPTRLWRPRHVLVTRSAAERDHGRRIVERCEAAGVDDVRLLDGDRLPTLRGETERETYARAKRTLAVVVAPPSQLRPQPIPPSADWRLDLARGCPAHCQYCYLAGSLQGPPVTRAYANLDDVLAPVRDLAGSGTVTTGDAARGDEGTTFELSCYTDPLGLERVTGSLSTAITQVGRGEHGDGVGLRFTTKYDDAAALVGLPHGGRTRMRVSVNSASVAHRFEGGTASVAARLAALRAVAADGYPVGMTVAPVMPLPGWREEYAALLGDAAAALSGLPDVDLTVELITHRFTEASRRVLLSWYPGTRLDLDESHRTEKRSKFGGVKYVYPREVMREMRDTLESQVATRLPRARVLYWT
ncbi:spore photoproduct lyase family protein [Nocardioides sp. CFH 31398]|uniref:spore photoproduct lyase family protein n=1 Tax=Nocardioides sp. CFH 31398 TaxID=2919579 RepID=UPI001F05A9D1|nr:radical SAM protein [Nocardioides sp. CFH 31398]MCH1867542.1 radical SAM protein [Nocardioides sp. CFH 31398]